MTKALQISPSILSADFGKLNEDIASVEPYVEVLHFDVMDGHFVPNLSFGAPILKCVQTELPVHCHLMVTNPEERLREFKEAGADCIIFHQEVVGNIPALIQTIRDMGMGVGISIKPQTSVETIAEFLPLLDQVLVMSVEPGFGGQAFIPESLDKIRELRRLKSDLDISVDGGINGQTATQAHEAGANILVAGSYIFKAADRLAAIASLRA